MLQKAAAMVRVMLSPVFCKSGKRFRRSVFILPNC
jgi:hypothetical protein